jgi:hypothetical protein
MSVSIVSPDWLQECKKKNERAEESHFPYYSLPPDNSTPSFNASQLNLLTMATQRSVFASSLQNTTTVTSKVQNSHNSIINLTDSGGLFSPLSQPKQRARYFCFTGLSETEKKRGSRIVTELGGLQAPLESPSWDFRVTHLISGRPSRSEKYLAAMASGAWILEMTYLEVCQKAGSFEGISEVDYEVGASNEKDSITTTTTVAERLDISVAGRRWRLNLAPFPDRPAIKGAFTGWRILLVCGDDKKRKDGFMRLLEAGGAVVSTLEDSILPDPITTTHLLLSSMNMKSRVKNDWLVHFDEQKIYTTEYIADYLMKPPVPVSSETK